MDIKELMERAIRDKGEGCLSGFCYLKPSDAAEDICAALSAAGFAIVPREPSKAVLQAAHDGPLMADDHHMDEKTEKWLREMHRAMIAASEEEKQ